MTDEEYQAAKPVIEMAQRMHHKLQTKLAETGVLPIDVLIAGVFQTYELAAALHGGRVEAIAWMRSAIDTIDRQSNARLN